MTNDEENNAISFSLKFFGIMNNFIHNIEESTMNAKDEEPQINAVRVRVQPFWRENPALWFKQLQAQFELSRITADRTKYNILVSNMESSVLNQVSDIIANPPLIDMYETLKARLLECYSDSEQSRLKKLLNNLSIGNRKPSHLLREMRELAGNDFGNSAIKSLWLQRLPPQMQAILSISDDNLDKLASMADKISDVSTTDIFSVTSTSNSTTNNDRFVKQSQDIIDQIAALTKRVDNMCRMRSRSRSQSNSKYRFRSKSNQNQNNKDICWYHSNYGDKAKKCIPPCTFKTNSEN